MTRITFEGHVFIHADTIDTRSDDMKQPLSRITAVVMKNSENLPLAGQHPSIFETKEVSRSALEEFSTFCENNNLRIFWGYASTDSIVRLQYAYQSLNMEYPWNWRDVRDVATLFRLYKEQPTHKKSCAREYCFEIVEKIKKCFCENEIGKFLYETYPPVRAPLFDSNGVFANLLFLSVGIIFGSLIRSCSY